MRQHSGNTNDLRPLKCRSDQPSGASKKHKQSDTKRDRASKKRSVPLSSFVKEALDNYLAIWLHRYDYLHAPHPDPGQKPNWQTESGYPLSDRLINQGALLYGVRIGPKTTYSLIDLDKGSPYHPQRDPFAVERICQALEPLGLVAHLTLTSSHSNGLHIYFPWEQPLPSWQIGIAITALLENAGFKIRPGWLEVFPNRKPFSANGKPSLFNGHRLPLQQGSYLLNKDLQPVASSQHIFFQQWKIATGHNDVNKKVLKRIIKQAQRKTYRVTNKAQKFLNDLNAEIEMGWSEQGQTNRLLGRIAMRSFIFGHILYAEAPLNGQRLVDDIVRIARSLPGFKEFCGHQKDLVKKAKEWQRSIEDSRYFPYGLKQVAKPVKENSGPSWNQQQQLTARQKIQQNVTDLCEQNIWPSIATKRFRLLCARGTSGSTLYNHKDLWHPAHIAEQQQGMENSPSMPEKLFCTRDGNPCAGGAKLPSARTSLLARPGCNTADSNAFSLRPEVIQSTNQQVGRNTADSKTSEQNNATQGHSVTERTAPPKQLALNIQWALQVAKANQQERADQNRQRYERQQHLRSTETHRAQLRVWMDSGDAILVAEAEQQIRRLDAAAHNIVDSG